LAHHCELQTRLLLPQLLWCVAVLVIDEVVWRNIVIYFRSGTFSVFRRITILPDHSLDVAVIAVVRCKATVLLSLLAYVTNQQVGVSAVSAAMFTNNWHS